MDPRRRWQVLQSYLVQANALLDEGAPSRALPLVEAALDLDPEFLAARDLRDAILRTSSSEFPAEPRPAAADAATPVEPVEPGDLWMNPEARLADAVDLRGRRPVFFADPPPAPFAPEPATVAPPAATTEPATGSGASVPPEPAAAACPTPAAAPHPAPPAAAPPATPPAPLTPAAPPVIEARARQRRAKRRLDAAREAFARGDLAAGREALDEARALTPDALDVAAVASELERYERRPSDASGRHRWLAVAAVFLCAVAAGALLAWYISAAQPSQSARSRVPASTFDTPAAAAEAPAIAQGEMASATEPPVPTSGSAAPPAPPRSSPEPDRSANALVTTQPDVAPPPAAPVSGDGRRIDRPLRLPVDPPASAAVPASPGPPASVNPPTPANPTTSAAPVASANPPASSTAVASANPPASSTAVASANQAASASAPATLPAGEPAPATSLAALAGATNSVPPPPPSSAAAGLPAGAVREPATGSSSSAPVAAVPPAPVASAPAAAERPRTGAPSSTAVVPPTIDDERLVRDVLQRYRAAYDALDATSAHAVWPSVNAGALSRAFNDLSEQELRFADCGVDVRGVVAQATCRGTTRYVPKFGAREPRVEARVWTFALRKNGTQWLIESARASAR